MHEDPRQHRVIAQKIEWWHWVIVGLAVVFFLYGINSYRAPGPSSDEFSAKNQDEKLLQQGNSDELADIEKDIRATDLTDLDRELGDIEAQLP